MKLTEERRNLFTLIGGDYVFAHCISADCAMGAGIAKQFTKRYSNIREVCKIFQPRIGDVITYKHASGDTVFNMVTKNKYWHKPNYNTLRRTLESLKQTMETLGYKKLAMPRIGSGLDRLSWAKVKEIIIEVFEQTDIEILICIK